MSKRPNPNDTEEDILKEQQEFLKNKVKPAVTLVKSDDLASKITNAPVETDTKVDKNEPAVTLIGNIIERQSKQPVNEPVLTARFATGFPQAKRRQVSGTSNKIGSIFSQQNKKLKDDKLVGTSVNLPPKSFILSGTNSSEIHHQNVETLSKMSEKEILEEQNKLLQTLDPKLVKFLKSKRKNEETKQPENMETNEIETNEPCITIEEIETPKEIIDSAEKWLHFETVETEKLQWMRNIEIPKSVGDNEQYEARFDFNGWLLPYTVPDISEQNRILYHHGEEPGRPGYTLKELFKLCRSNVQQQRILALNTISNILSLNSTGIYDNIIDIPIEQIFFVIRITLDDNTPNILNASMKTLHNLFYYQIDETCLDSLHGFGFGLVQPMLTVDDRMSNKDDDRDVNDQQLAEMDLVRCLVRSDILIRIRYIINTVKPSTETIVYCLELLTRLLRDSQKIFTQIYNTENLFSSIIRNFVPKIYKLESTSNNCYGKPLVSAIKLLRIAACRSKTVAEDLIKRHHIMESIQSYISNQIGENITGVQLQIESFKLVAVLFRYKLGIEYFSALQPFLLSILNYHFQNTNCNESSSYTVQLHCSVVLNLISEVTMMDYNLISNFIPLLMQCCTKYFTQVSNLTNFKCGNLQIISSLLVALATVFKYSRIKSDDYLENLVFSLLSSSGFNKITENIMVGSNLLSQFDTHKTGPNFMSVESAVGSTSQHTLPCLNTTSCIPFLTALSYFIETTSTKLILKFLQHSNINKYLLQIKNCSKFNLTSNWFTKLESELILNILKCSIKAQNQLNNLFLYYELTVKSLSIFTIEQKIEIDYLLQNIVFNKQYYPSELLMNEMNINEHKEDLLNIVPNLGEIYECYSNIMALKKNQHLLQTSLTIDSKIGNIIPIDWIFSPIVSLYSQFEENSLKKVDEANQIFIVTRCLQWLFLYENYFPDLSSFINPTDRFCRLSCIFLCSNTLFLEKDIHKLLELCLKALIRPENFVKLDFDQPIQGLNNFQDFYVQLLEQYQGVSYGDKLFANFILIPLTQRNNVKWRKILWSEYLGVAQTIILDLNQCVIDIKEFIDPPESDVSLLKCYRRSLVSNQLSRSPFLKFVANFHVENYVRNLKSTVG